MIGKHLLAAGALLLATVSAGRLDRVARNKGFHPNAIRDLEAREELQRRGAGSQAQTERRYYNDKSASTRSSPPASPIH